MLKPSSNIKLPSDLTGDHDYLFYGYVPACIAADGGGGQFFEAVLVPLYSLRYGCQERPVTHSFASIIQLPVHLRIYGQHLIC